GKAFLILARTASYPCFGARGIRRLPKPHGAALALGFLRRRPIAGGAIRNHTPGYPPAAFPLTFPPQRSILDKAAMACSVLPYHPRAGRNRLGRCPGSFWPIPKPNIKPTVS